MSNIGLTVGTLHAWREARGENEPKKVAVSIFAIERYGENPKQMGYWGVESDGKPQFYGADELTFHNLARYAAREQEILNVRRGQTAADTKHIRVYDPVVQAIKEPQDTYEAVVGACSECGRPEEEPHTAECCQGKSRPFSHPPLYVSDDYRSSAIAQDHADGDHSGCDHGGEED